MISALGKALMNYGEQGSVNRMGQQRFAVILTMVLSICLALAMLRIQISALSYVSQAIFVDASNVGDPYEDGSQGHPFDLIQEGVNASISGDFVEVAAGIYYEEVVLSKNKSGISLIGGEGVSVDGEGRRNGIQVGFRTYPDFLTDVSITGFTVRNCVKGIDLIRCRNVRLRNNTMIGNAYHFADYSLGANDVDASNTVDGKPIYYWVGEHDRQVPSDAGFVALINSRAIVLRDLVLKGNGQGVLLKNSNSCRIENVSFLNNQDGVYFDVESTNNAVIGNNILNNTVMGVYLSASSGNIFSGNTVAGSQYGFYLSTSSGECKGNIMINNVIQNHQEGVVLEGVANLPIMENDFENNMISNNNLGIQTYLSASNRVYHNNFINNTVPIESNESKNIFDYSGEGNYWNNHKGVDEDNDGISETPYLIDEQNADNFPLMGLFRTYDITWGGTSFSVETISSSTISNVSLNQSRKMIGFIEDSDNNATFCRITFAEKLLGGPYLILLDGEQIGILNEGTNGTHSFLYFLSPHSGGLVEIFGETVIPEFSSILLSFLFLMATITGAIVVKIIATRTNASDEKRQPK